MLCPSASSPISPPTSRHATQTLGGQTYGFVTTSVIWFQSSSGVKVLDTAGSKVPGAKWCAVGSSGVTVVIDPPTRTGV